MARCTTVCSILIILCLFHASLLRCQSLSCPRIRHDSESIPSEADYALQGPLHDIIPRRSIDLQQPLTIAKVVAQFRDAIRCGNVLPVNQQHALPPMGAVYYNHMQRTVVWRTPRKHDPEATEKLNTHEDDEPKRRGGGLSAQDLLRREGRL